MDPESPDTKTQLVLAAGELFAEHGFEGVSTRMIADKAGVNLGCIHYHFGSKENLYIAAFRYVCDHDSPTELKDVLERRPELRETPEGRAEAIREACELFFTDFFSERKPAWNVRLIARELSQPSSAMPLLVRDVFSPSHREWVEFYRACRPEASEDEADVWGVMIKAQAVFFLMSRAPMEMVRGGRPMGEAFFSDVARMLARALILLAGLPLPPELVRTS